MTAMLAVLARSAPGTARSPAPAAQILTTTTTMAKRTPAAAAAAARLSAAAAAVARRGTRSPYLGSRAAETAEAVASCGVRRFAATTPSICFAGGAGCRPTLPSTAKARCRWSSSSSSSKPSASPDSSGGGGGGGGSPPVSRLRSWWRDGSVLIWAGWAGLGLVVFDRVLQHFDRQDAGVAVAQIEDEQRRKRMELFEAYRDEPSVFRCVVRQEYKMGGSHGLKGVKVDDILDVLEEGVGPGKYYNMCRRTDPETGNALSVGWYPIAFLEKMETDDGTTGEASPRKRRWIPF